MCRAIIFPRTLDLASDLPTQRKLSEGTEQFSSVTPIKVVGDAKIPWLPTIDRGATDHQHAKFDMRFHKRQEQNMRGYHKWEIKVRPHFILVLVRQEED